MANFLFAKHLEEARTLVGQDCILSWQISYLPNLNLTGIDWAIVGGESGPGARAMAPEWVINIRQQCLRTGVPFFFKQWGGVRKKKNGRLLEGHPWEQMPVGAN